MFSFDEKNRELCIYKVPYNKPDYTYKDSDMYKSYCEYVQKGAKEDITSILLPAINKELGTASHDDFLRLWIEECTSFCDKYASYKGDEYWSVRVKLGVMGFDNGVEPFVILKIPYMDRFGVITRAGKQYAMISELAQDDDITFKDNELKVMTKSGYNITMLPSGKGSAKPMIKFNKKKLDAISVLFALADKEGLDKVELFDKLSSFELNKQYPTRQGIMMQAEYYKEDIIIDYLNILETSEYDLSVVRSKINDVLSIDRALGKQIGRTIDLGNGETIDYGTTITQNVLRKLKQYRVNEIYVQDIPNMVGNYLAEHIVLNLIVKGTRILPCLEGQIKGQDGMYVDNNIHLEDEDVVIIPEGTLVTEGFLEMLAYNGLEGVCLKETLTTKNVMYVPFSSAIIGNRHFREKDLGISISSRYVYVKEDGTVCKQSNALTAYDLLAMIAYWYRLRRGLDYDSIADRDLGLRKKVNQANELFHKAFGKVVKEQVRSIKQRLVNAYKDNILNFVKADFMEDLFAGFSTKLWRYLFTEMRVIQPIDKLNPLSFCSSLQKVNTIVKDKNAVKADQHSLSMGHFYRICLYETPSGKTMGIVGNKAINCRIEDKQMKAPYFRIKHFDGKSYIDTEVIWMTVREEENFRLGSITLLEVDWNTREILNKERVLARIPTEGELEKMTVSYIDVQYLDFVNVNPQQTDALPSTTIPFQGADDSARVIFGVSMAKQAKGLVSGDIPIVSTSGFEDAIRLTDYYMIHAEYDGTVVEAANDYVVVEYDNGERIGYRFDMKEFATNSVIIRVCEVEVDQRVKAGDVLVSSNYTKEGHMVTGKNALIAFAPMGYNYEDGVYASQRLSTELLSYGCSHESIPLSKIWSQAHVREPNKFKYCKKGKSILTLVRGRKENAITKDIKATKLKGFIFDYKPEMDNSGKWQRSIRAEAVSIDYLQPGDKVVNRHGNKGVTPKINDNNKMPMFKNGEFVDIVYNTNGVPSRMNIGQVLEASTGFVGYILGIRVRSDSFNGAEEDEIALLLQYTWDLANGDNWESIFAKQEYASIPKNLHEFVKTRKANIRMWEDTFNPDGTAWMINPQTGQYFETPVLVGVNYVYKLYHEVFKKEHARAGFCSENYVNKLDMAPKGSSNKGGQRMGYMELDAYMAYGASKLIQELTNGRGDNGVARNNLTVEHVHTTDDYMLDPKTGIRRSTEFFVSIMQALGVTIDFEGLLPNKVPEDYDKRKIYKKNTILLADLSSEKSEKKESNYSKTLDEIENM